MSTDVDRLIQSLYGELKKLEKIDRESVEYISIREGLGCLGKHPLLLKHALLELKASGKELNKIDLIRAFPLLMYVNVSHNSIVDLLPLQFLPTLVQLNASYNQITQCLDFAPPKCTYDNSWSSGEYAIGSMLVRANLSHNEIETLIDLSHHPFLECLILSHNKILNIDGLQSLRYLKILDLSYNKISDILGLDDLPIQELNLSGNFISKLDGLSNLPYLSSLNVADNQIISLSPLESCAQLHYLDIRANQVEYIRQVEFLRELTWLRVLCMINTPASKKAYYRLRVVYILPSLSQLDLVAVSAEEKILAMNLKNDENGDNEHRNIMFGKYFPNSFIPDAVLADTLNEFIDDEEDVTMDDLIRI